MNFRRVFATAVAVGAMACVATPSAQAAEDKAYATVYVLVTGDCRVAPRFDSAHSGGVVAGHNYYWSGAASGAWLELYCNNNTWRWFPEENVVIND
ncbi:hypothetical protein [Actinophytocola oryzae]|uniref:Secreted protein n=1 Tax=Actinophytocola oryzae TaxID=502181 RepID=A0A4R7W2T7_9PSEU|nr:hypothetical protein [Actinophytocola oryzae]TDV56199.1 hypothetical protein CLV71_102265 [Actinophytocola oryzae]